MKTISEIAIESGHNVNRIKHSIRVLGLKEDRRIGNCLLFEAEKEIKILAYADEDHRRKGGSVESEKAHT